MTDEGDARVSGQQRAADVADVADARLRSALEYAVRIAVAFQKKRPPLDFPAGLKPYLKVQHLDAAALRAVRRAVVADDQFRDRLGRTDPTVQVDDLGTAWLRCAEGWESEVQRLLVDARKQETEASAGAALRRSERRREGAEQLADRAQAELLGHHEALARERTRRERAEDLSRAALTQVTDLREEITGLRREVDRVRSRLEAETARASIAEHELAAATKRVADMERVRDELLLRRHPVAEGSAASPPAPPVATVEAEPPTVPPAAPPARSRANAEAARALQRAAAATRELSAALVAAGEALDDEHRAPDAVGPARHARSASAGMPAVKPVRGRNDRRKPIPIPGGLYGDSVAAVDHMLRVAGVCVIVDGYNVAKLGWPQLELADQRERCIDLLEDLVRRLNTDIRVVFDGSDVVGASSGRRLIPVQFSPSGVSADDVIRDDVQALPPLLPAVVVTNDQAIARDVRAAGVNVVSTDALLEFARRSAPR